MVDRIGKAFEKMSTKERKAVQEVIGRIVAGDLNGLDVQKLKGWSDAYRVRKGNFRIIFRLIDQTHPILLDVQRRSDTTYSF